MGIKLWPVEHLLLARLHEPKMSTMEDRSRSLSSFESERVVVGLCWACGHEPHVARQCWASVSLEPDQETYWREQCTCETYRPDDGSVSWSADGRRR